MNKKMINLLGFIFAGLMAISLPVESARANVEQPWKISTNPFGYFLGVYSASASYALTNQIAVNVQPEFLYAYFVDPVIWGLGARAGVPIYFDQTYDGFYLEPGFVLNYVRQNGSGLIEATSGVMLGPDLIAGHNWLWASGFNIDLGIGLGYKWVSFDTVDTKAGTFDGILPTARLSFGYAF
ncbi:MAG: DUF3575 domain-containing protein [Bdellovibrionota bacterium]